MRAVIIASAATIPAAVWAVTPPRVEPLAVKSVMTEGVREQRSDNETFRARWAGVTDMPPATVLRFVSADATTPKTTRRVEAPPMRSRRARLDLCQRHHMRKVHYGRSWRCRR